MTRPVAVGRADLQAIAAPVDLGLDLGRRAGRGIGACRSATRRVLVCDSKFHEPSRLYHCQRCSRRISSHLRPLASTALPSAPEQDGLEACGLAFLGLAALEQRLDADAGRLQVDGQRDGALDGAAAGFPQLQDHVGFQRPAGLRQRRAAARRCRPCPRRRWRAGLRAACARAPPARRRGRTCSRRSPAGRPWRASRRSRPRRQGRRRADRRGSGRRA